MIITATEINQVENHIEVLNLLEVNLEIVLVEEYKQGFSNDSNNIL